MELKEEIEDLLQGYYKWLKDSTTIDEIDEVNQRAVLTTPHIDRHNDMLQLMVKRVKDGYVLSDNGYILSDLASGGCFINSARRRALLTQTLNGFGVSNENEKLVAYASKRDFPVTKHSLLQAMLAVNDMFYLVSPRVSSRARSFFPNDVQTWLYNKEVRFVSDNNLVGKSGYAHKFDFMIPADRKQPERILKTINRPSKQAAVNLIMAWQDVLPSRLELVKQSQKPPKPYAVLNNANRLESERASEALRQYEITPVQWSEREQFVRQLAA